MRLPATMSAALSSSWERVKRRISGIQICTVHRMGVQSLLLGDCAIMFPCSAAAVSASDITARNTRTPRWARACSMSRPRRWSSSARRTGSDRVPGATRSSKWRSWAISGYHATLFIYFRNTALVAEGQQSSCRARKWRSHWRRVRPLLGLDSQGRCRFQGNGVRRREAIMTAGGGKSWCSVAFPMPTSILSGACLSSTTPPAGPDPSCRDVAV